MVNQFRPAARVREFRRKTCRLYTSKEKTRIVLEGIKGEDHGDPQS